MEQVIYGDILFIINFSMDFLCLFLTARLVHIKAGTLPLLLSASLGALYATISLFIKGNTIFSAIISVMVAALMCYIAYAPKRIRDIFKQTLLFCGVSFLLGGAMSGAYNLMRGSRAGRRIIIDGNINTLYSEIPAGWFIVAALISAVAVLIGGRIYRSRISSRHIEVKLEFAEREVTLDCLCDTGNLLTEPLSGIPVLVTSYLALEPLLPQNMRELFRTADISLLRELDISRAAHVRVIPALGVSGSALMIALIPDRAEINGQAKRLCIAVAKDAGDFAESDALMPAELL